MDDQALVFDVFGTVVDWRSTIICEGEALGREKNIYVDWGAFADAWRSRYAPSMDQVRRGGSWTSSTTSTAPRWRSCSREFGIEV